MKEVTYLLQPHLNVTYGSEWWSGVSYKAGGGSLHRDTQPSQQALTIQTREVRAGDTALHLDDGSRGHTHHDRVAATPSPLSAAMQGVPEQRY